MHTYFRLQVESWLAASHAAAEHEHSLLLLSLLGHLPMTVDSRRFEMGAMPLRVHRPSAHPGLLGGVARPCEA